MNIKKITLNCLTYFFLLSILNADENTMPSLENRIIITEKADYSTYFNGKYIGLTFRESRSYIIETEIDNGKEYCYDGEVFVIQKTRKDMLKTAMPIDSIMPITFKFIPEQEEDDIENPYEPQIFSKDSGYPLLRNFPHLPDKPFTDSDIGKTWLGKSTVSVRPKPEKNASRIPIDAEFKYNGKTIFNNKSVHYVSAVFALNYKHTDNLGDEQLIKSKGGRKVDIYLDDKNTPLFIREKIDEEFFYIDGNRIKHRGFLLHFYSYSGKSYEEPVFSQKTEITPTKDFDVIKTKRGTMLKLKNLRFAADKAILLAGEENKLDEIARILKESNAEFFFVEGHTADLGRHREEKLLSEERAKAIIEELIKRGISGGKFIYQGAGGTKPIAPNDTEDGRAQNRRVEITIID